MLGKVKRRRTQIVEYVSPQENK